MKNIRLNKLKAPAAVTVPLTHCFSKFSYGTIYYSQLGGILDINFSFQLGHTNILGYRIGHDKFRRMPGYSQYPPWQLPYAYRAPDSQPPPYSTYPLTAPVPLPPPPQRQSNLVVI